MLGLVLDVQAGDDHGHRVAVAAEHVERDLEVVGGGLPRVPVSAHPVRARLAQLDRVEVRDDVGVEVGGLADLVEQLGGDRSDGDGPPVPSCLVMTLTPSAATSAIGKPG